MPAAAEASRLPDATEVDRPWLASYPPGVPACYEIPDVPVPRLLDDAAHDFPDTPAVRFLGETLTYRALLDRVDRLAAALQLLGVRPRDRVGLLLPASPQQLIALFAVLRLGAVATAHDVESDPATLAHELDEAGCRVVVLLDTAYPALSRLRGRLRTVEHIVATGLYDELGPVRRLRADGLRRASSARGAGLHRFGELIARTAPTATQERLDPRRDLAALLYTQGRAQRGAAMLTHGNLVASAFQLRLWVPDVKAGQEDLLCAAPLSNAYGLSACLSLGVLSAGTVTLLPGCDRATVLRAIDRWRPSLLVGTAAMYAALDGGGRSARADLTSLRVCLSAGAPLDAAAAERFEQRSGARLREGFACATSPVTHANPVYGRAKRGRIGLPLPNTASLLVDPADGTTPVAPGRPGALLVAGPQVARGFWRRPEETAMAFDGGWLRTGDLAEVDEDGYYALVAGPPG